MAKLLLSGLLLTVCSAQLSNVQCPGVANSNTGAVTWTTQWCDEFNGAANSAIDSSKWVFDTGNLGVNNEPEIYCDPSSNAAPCDSSNPNAFINGSGHLAIQARGPSANVWTSARLKSEGKQTFNSGRIEASLQIPSMQDCGLRFGCSGRNLVFHGRRSASPTSWKIGRRLRTLRARGRLEIAQLFTLRLPPATAKANASPCPAENKSIPPFTRTDKSGQRT